MERSAPAVFEIGLVLLLAAAAGWAARRMGLPAVIGFLAVGLALSPFTPGYVADREQLQLLADVGVVLLLFEVGIEVDVRRLSREQGALAWAAPLQTVLTTAIAGTAAYLAGVPPIGAAILGLAVALSSGVVIVNITRSRRRTTDRSTEETLLGWSALQDVTGVGLAAILVGLLGLGNRPITVALLGLVGFVVLAVAAAWFLPRVLAAVRGEPDLFLVISVAGALAVAGIGSLLFGVPLALAAFTAGLAIVEGPDASAARQKLGPFRDVFAVLFFVAIGSLVDPAQLPASLPWIALLIGAMLVAKTLVSYGLARFARLPARPVQLAVGLSQLGEFSFVLATVGLAGGVLAPEVYAAVLSSVIVTIAASTVLVRLAGTRPPVASMEPPLPI